MAITYRVVDIRGDVIDPKETLITGARTPEDAVREALKLEVVRSGQRKDMVARVYGHSRHLAEDPLFRQLGPHRIDLKRRRTFLRRRGGFDR